MGKPFSITKNCYIYVEPSETKVMKAILKALTKHRSLSGRALARETGKSQIGLTTNLWKLIAKRLVRVEQHGRARIYFLWRRLKSYKT